MSKKIYFLIGSIFLTLSSPAISLPWGNILKLNKKSITDRAGESNFIRGKKRAVKKQQERETELLEIVQEHGYESLSDLPKRAAANLLSGMANPLVLLEEGKSFLVKSPSMNVFNSDELENLSQLKAIQEEIFWRRFHISSDMWRKLVELFLNESDRMMKNQIKHLQFKNFMEDRMDFFATRIRADELWGQFFSELIRVKEDTRGFMVGRASLKIMSKKVSPFHIFTSHSLNLGQARSYR